MSIGRSLKREREDTKDNSYKNQECFNDHTSYNYIAIKYNRKKTIQLFH